jgi:hypothetical protein
MNGLTTSQVSELQKQYGLNVLITGNKKTLFPF